MLTIAIDFDGTLVDEDDQGFYHLIPGSREALLDMRARGYRIVIHTCRTGIASSEGRLGQELAVIRQTLDHFSVPYDEIFVGEKMVADFYIDDRAIAFDGNWVTTLETLTQGAKTLKYGA